MSSWLDIVRKEVKTEVGSDYWDGGLAWSDFLQGVLRWLHEQKFSRAEIKMAAVGLIKYGIRNETRLRDAAGDPPDSVNFNAKLTSQGVPGVVCDGLFNRYAPFKKQATILTRARASGCSTMKADDLVDLSKVFYQEPYVHPEPDAEHDFIDRVRERQELEKVLTPVLTAKRIDKQSRLVVEYATISGAGKTRWMFHAFKNWKRDVGGETLKANVVHLNFNGADRANDCLAIQDLEMQPHHAAARLLLSRGLVHCEPAMTWLMQGKLKDSDLPEMNAIVDAIFKSRFDDGKGLLVVHLDELHILRKNRINLHLSLYPKEEQRKMREHCVQLVSQWLKAFYGLICGLSDYEKRRFVVVVITHTSPGGRVIGDRELSSIAYEPLKLFPFTMEQSFELLNAKRHREGLSLLGGGRERSWSAFVALAGGHPSLLLDAYSALTEAEDADYNDSTTSSVMISLVTNNRVRKILLDDQTEESKVDTEPAWLFVEKVLKRELISDQNSEYEGLFNSGVAWYLPREDMNRMGYVSAPFPYLLKLMQKAGGMYAIVADQIDPTRHKYEPTKAMEYVAALALMLKERGDTDTWASIAVPHGKAMEAIENAHYPFVTVWTSQSEKATNFGGKISSESGLKAVVGQVKMQRPGKDTLQKLPEVMNLAWFIGRYVRKGALTGPVHAHFVSSRRAPNMTNLCRAFLVAMSGSITEQEAYSLAKAEYEPKKKGNADIRNVIKYLALKVVIPAPAGKYQFTYVGRAVDNSIVDEAFVEMSTLLPRGVFAHWC